MSAGRRLFFALWPDEPEREAVVERFQTSGLRDALGGRPVPVHNLHLTLVFLGTVPDECFDRLHAAAGQFPRPGRFSLRLDRFGIFAPARVAWLGAEPVPAAVRLVDALRGVAGTAGVPIDERPWCPHVTLLRRIEGRAAPRLPPPPTPLDWPVRAFALVESIPGRPYQVLRTWPVE